MPVDSNEAHKVTQNDEKVKCLNCGRIWSKEDNFCGSCGAMLSSCDSSEVNRLNGGGIGNGD